ncbi:hypothetical protein SPRG_04883 [Saprolegnia parasitica CBS 223.65]|uniref:Uncharacterized protein n=1 Tax=Saprolegnia parasitica (strain CBS 223.65) TaxID=695850 RepID=A0A067CTB5_SAPPC|nr:hypothetical protein SPRG_04883 [Saprolegnia parasitica CBS 223.65]KDO29766.1 hypothetical protein SPRG_04883 [Saprolegnia parasitica CBS 223.65]|eukprot:XP_012199414.1 hypothetical protein SPRG_04883 [Saprolegnia parasitica CBS 223.65]
MVVRVEAYLASTDDVADLGLPSPPKLRVFGEPLASPPSRHVISRTSYQLLWWGHLVSQGLILYVLLLRVQAALATTACEASVLNLLLLGGAMCLSTLDMSALVVASLAAKRLRFTRPRLACEASLATWSAEPPAIHLVGGGALVLWLAQLYDASYFSCSHTVSYVVLGLWCLVSCGTVHLGSIGRATWLWCLQTMTLLLLGLWTPSAPPTVWGPSLTAAYHQSLQAGIFAVQSILTTWVLWLLPQLVQPSRLVSSPLKVRQWTSRPPSAAASTTPALHKAKPTWPRLVRWTTRSQVLLVLAAVAWEGFCVAVRRTLPGCDMSRAQLFTLAPSCLVYTSRDCKSVPMLPRLMALRLLDCTYTALPALEMLALELINCTTTNTTWDFLPTTTAFVVLRNVTLHDAMFPSALLSKPHVHMESSMVTQWPLNVITSALKTLVVANTQLPFPPTHIRLPNLVALHFTNNNASVIEAVQEDNALRLLNVSHNPLTHLPPSVWQLPHVHTVDVRMTQMSSVPARLSPSLRIIFATMSPLCAAIEAFYGSLDPMHLGISFARSDASLIQCRHDA